MITIAVIKIMQAQREPVPPLYTCVCNPIKCYVTFGITRDENKLDV